MGHGDEKWVNSNPHYLIENPSLSVCADNQDGDTGIFLGGARWKV